jgi:hypothetical protein
VVVIHERDLRCELKYLEIFSWPYPSLFQNTAWHLLFFLLIETLNSRDASQRYGQYGPYTSHHPIRWIVGGVVFELSRQIVPHKLLKSITREKAVLVDICLPLLCTTFNYFSSQRFGLCLNVSSFDDALSVRLGHLLHDGGSQ